MTDPDFAALAAAYPAIPSAIYAVEVHLWAASDGYRHLIQPGQLIEVYKQAGDRLIAAGGNDGLLEARPRWITRSSPATSPARWGVADMAETSIEWTDKVWNPTTGCTRVSPECKNCYAFALHDMRHAAHKTGKQVPAQYAKPFTELQMFEGRLTDPLSWRKSKRVFVNSMSDLFHKDIPDTFVDRVFAVMAMARWHTFQVLTKRPERLLDYVTDLEASGPTDSLERIACEVTEQRVHCDPPLAWPLVNVWLGVSVGTRKRKDWIDVLRTIPAAVRFLSCEPLLEDLGTLDLTGISWVIVGGESGPNSRPLRPEWVRRIVRQCCDAGVTVFVKQLGSNIEDRNDAGFDGNDLGGWPACQEYGGHIVVEHDIHGFREEYQGADVRVRLRDKKGGDPGEWPADLRIRQFPDRKDSP